MKLLSGKTWLKNFTELFKGNSIKATLFKDGLWSLVINSINRVFTIIIGILLVRVLGKTQYGIYTYVLSMVVILIIPVEYGLSNLIVRETAKADSTKQPGLMFGVWRWSFKVTFAISIILVLIGLVAYLLWGKAYFSSNELNTFLWGLTILVFLAVMHISNAALRGQKKIVLGQITDLIFMPALFTAMFILIWLTLPHTLTSTSAMALRSIASFLALVISLGFLYWKTPKRVFLSKPIAKTREWINSVMPLGLSSGLNMLKNHASILILGFFVSAGEIGAYQIAVSTAALAALVLHSMNTLLAPHFASYYAKNETKRLQQLVTISSRVVFLFNLFMTIIFVGWGKTLLSWVFGRDTIDAYPALLVLLAGQLVNSLVGSVAFLLNMTGHEKDVMKVIGISTIINVLINVILTPHLGITGAAIATSISLIFAQITMFIIVKKRLGITSSAVMKIS